MDEQVLARAIEVFESREDALEWLNSPIPTLGNKSPMSYLGTPDGILRVMNLLGQMEWGLIT
jgi:putative toxin-antitoxin system antitoxin component (TIGR02293 family)